MGLRIRSLRLALLAALLLALNALPDAWLPQVPGDVFGPATVWAGGTPDETLHPLPTPPTKSGASSQRRDRSISMRGEAINDRLARRTSIRTFDRLMAIWTFVRATTLRM